MKKRLLKTLLCFTMASAMFLGDIGTAFAAETAVQQETGEAVGTLDGKETPTTDAEDKDTTDDSEVPAEDDAAQQQEDTAGLADSSETDAQDTAEDVKAPEEGTKDPAEDVKAPAEDTEGPAEDVKAPAENQEEKENTGVPAAGSAENKGLEADSAKSGQADPSGTTSEGQLYTPKVSSISATVDEYWGELEVNWSGTGESFKVYINDKLYNTYYNYNDYEDESTSRSFTYYGMKKGSNYTVKIVPYTSANMAGTAATVTKRIEFGKISSVGSSIYTVTSSQGGGYGRPQIYLHWTYSKSGSAKYDVYRSKKSGSGYAKIGSTTSTYYYDSAIGMGTYYYKICPAEEADTYVKAASGSYSSVCKVTVPKLTGYCSVGLDENNKAVVECSSDYNYVSGYEVYRSTKRTSGYKKAATISDTIYTDKSVKAGSTYYYKVKPYYYDTTGKKKYAGNYSEPRGVKLVMGYFSFETAKAVSTTKAKLTWTKVSGADGYEIYVKSDLTGDAYKLLTTTKKLSYTKGGLSNGATYYFQVRAYKNQNNVKTYYTTGSTSVTTGLQSPKNTLVKKTYIYSKGQMTIKNKITWDKVYGAGGYYVMKSDGSGNYKKIATLKSGASSYTYTQKVAGSSDGNKNVSLRIVAYKGSAQYYSSVSCNAGLPNVKSVSVKKKGTDGTAIAWKKATGATEYTVYRVTPTGTSHYVGQTNKTSITDSGLTPGVRYTYRVTANNSKLGLYSNDYNYQDESEITNTRDFTLSLAKPSITAAKNSASKKATVTWKGNTLAQKYVIYRSTSKNGKYTKVKTVSAKTTSYTDSKLTKGKTYYYKIKAYTVNDAGLGVYSGYSGVKGVKILK